MKEQAHAVADELAREFPTDVYAQHVFAQVYRLSGDTDTAEKTWRRCLALEEGFLPAYEEIVQILIRRGDFSQAEITARRGLAFHPKSIGLRNLLASVLLEQGRNDETIAVIKAGQALGVESPEGWFLLGQAYQRKQQHEGAREALERAIALKPDFTQAHYALSVSLTRLGQRDGAAKHRAIFQELNARDQQANASTLRVGSDEFVRKTVAAVFHQAGVIFSNHGNQLRAAECWLMAASLDAEHRPSRQALAVFYRQHGQAREALDVLKELQQLEPTNLEHQIAQGMCYLQLGDAEQAAAVFESVLAEEPDAAAAAAGLARALLQSGRELQLARHWAERAVAISSTPDHWVVLAVACAELGDLEGARTAVAKALTLDPSYAPARRANELLQQGL